MQDEGRAVARKEIWMKVFDFEQIATWVKAELGLVPLDPYYNPYLWQLCPCITIVILTYPYYIGSYAHAAFPYELQSGSKGTKSRFGFTQVAICSKYFFHPVFFSSHRMTFLLHKKNAESLESAGNPGIFSPYSDLSAAHLCARTHMPCPWEGTRM